MVLEPPTNPTARRMWAWLPVMWYARSRTAQGLLEAQGEALDQGREDIQAVRDARLPQTADRWGLERLRQEVGLEAIPDESDDDLRARIIAQFRSFGSTIFRLRQIALSWQYGDVDIIADPEMYRIIVQLNDTRGQPADLEAHGAALRANIQAHLGPVVFVVVYLTWDEVRRSGVTWQQLVDHAITWEQLRRMTYQQLLAIAQGG